MSGRQSREGSFTVFASSRGTSPVGSEWHPFLQNKFLWAQVGLEDTADLLARDRPECVPLRNLALTFITTQVHLYRASFFLVSVLLFVLLLFFVSFCLSHLVIFIHSLSSPLSMTWRSTTKWGQPIARGFTSSRFHQWSQINQINHLRARPEPDAYCFANECPIYLNSNGMFTKQG